MLNKSQRIAAIIERDGPGCVWCSYELVVGDPDLTTEHLVPKSKGGASDMLNEVAACARCNNDRKVRKPVSYALECLAKGKKVRTNIILERLEAMSKSSNRKSRSYIANQYRNAQKQL